MSQLHQRQLLDHPQTLSRSERQENTPLINRSRSTTADSDEEMRAMPNIGTETDCLERLYQVTDVVLVICGIMVIIAVVVSIGIGILGISRKLQGLGFYTNSF